MVKAKIATEIVLKEKDIQFLKPASRAELFVRIAYGIAFFVIYFVYSIVYGIITMVFYIVAGILNTIQWLIILITAKRWEPAFTWTAKAAYERAVFYSIKLSNYQLRFLPYMMWMTDERPSFGMHDKNDSYFKKVK